MYTCRALDCEETFSTKQPYGICIKCSGQGSSKTNKRSKYGAVRTEYGGRMYDSAKEARWAANLDILKRVNEVVDWVPQFRIDIPYLGKHLCYYLADFKVTFPDGRIEYWDVKGGKATQTAAFKLKWKMLHILHPDYNFLLKDK